MANKPLDRVTTIHGTTPHFLIEKIIRTRIYESLYWKEACFGLTAESAVDKAVCLTNIGGQYSNQKPTEFLCLVLKLLLLTPEREIIQLYIYNDEFKYLTALGVFYLRLTGSPVDIYKTLEPLLLDYRKLRYIMPSGEYKLTYMDEFVDNLLTLNRVCDVILPYIPARTVLEETGQLEPRICPLDLNSSDSENFSDNTSTISSDSTTP